MSHGSPCRPCSDHRRVDRPSSADTQIRAATQACARLSSQVIQLHRNRRRGRYDGALRRRSEPASHLYRHAPCRSILSQTGSTTDSSSNTDIRPSSPRQQAATPHSPPRSYCATRINDTTHTTLPRPSSPTCSSGVRRSRCPTRPSTRANGGRMYLSSRALCRGGRPSRRARNGIVSGTSGPHVDGKAARGISSISHNLHCTSYLHSACIRPQPTSKIVRRDSEPTRPMGDYTQEPLISLMKCICAGFSVFVYIYRTLLPPHSCYCTNSNEQARRPGSYR